jgi:hypothetical protein
VAETLGDAVLHLRTDDSKLDAGLDAAKGKADAVGNKFSAVSARVSDVGKNLSLAVTLPLVAFAGKAMAAATESAQAMAQVDASLKSMGPIAGRTSEQLQEMAGKLEDISLFDDDDILKSVTANLLTFGNIAGEAFDQAQLAAVNLSAKLGGDLKGSTMMLGKALNDPVKGISALTKAGVSFTEAQKAQIKAMAEAGDLAGAQKIILGELEKQFAGSAKAQRDATPTAAAAQQWRKFEEVVGGIALKALPPLTSALTSVLSAFNNLDPGTQSLVAGLAAAAAAAGPLLLVGGTLAPMLISLIGKTILFSGGLLGLASSEAVAATGSFAFGASLRAAAASALAFARGILSAAIPAIASLLVSLAPILIPLAAVTAAVGLVYLAWKNWDKIKPIIDAVGSVISGWWTSNVQPILDAVGNKVKQLVAIFQDYFGKQIKNVVAIVTALMNGDFRGAWEAMKRFVSNAITGAYEIVKGFAPNVARTLSSMAQSMVQIGRDIISGLVSGIQANAAAVWNALKNVVLAGIKNVKDFLGIKSPSRVFMEIGGNITDGLAGGIQDGIPTVAAAMDALGKTVADGAEQWSVDVNGGPIDLSNAPVPSAARNEPGQPSQETESRWREGFTRWFSDGIKAALDGDLGGFVGGWLSKIGDSFLKEIGDFLGNELGGLLGGGVGGSGGLFGAIQSLFAGGFATGGMIPTGKFGIVGEKGPEPIISTARGALVRPNASLGSFSKSLQPAAASINMPINIDATGADAAGLARVQRSIDQLRSDLPSTIASTVQDGGERGIFGTSSWR